MAGTPGTILYQNIAFWPNNIPLGIFEQCNIALAAAGFSPNVCRDATGVQTSDIPTVQNVFNTYAGSPAELAFNQNQKQKSLDALLLNNFNLVQFIQTGTAFPITGAQIGTFLATITTNYRTLKSQIAAATTPAQVQAININSGWPSNP